MNHRVKIHFKLIDLLVFDYNWTLKVKKGKTLEKYDT